MQAGYPAVKSRSVNGAPPELANILKLPVSYRTGAFQECSGCFADMLASVEVLLVSFPVSCCKPSASLFQVW